MAASTSTAANPNNENFSDFDVFISHRGPEVKKTFASHLHRRLRSFGLRVFLDQPELQRGASIISQFESAIRTASVQVPIFSPAYADSKWCLNEFVSMLETLETLEPLQTGATLIPIFYNVEPSELRGNAGNYAEALDILEKKMDGEKSRHDPRTIQKWRDALSRIPEKSGFELKACNGDEGELLDKVVEDVLKKVKRTRLDVADHPTGLPDKVNDFESFFSRKQNCAKPQIVGIVGLGGIGKTTLVKELFNRKSLHYSRSCFLSLDVEENGSTPFSILSLQNKLLKSLIGSDLKIDDINEGKTKLSKPLKSLKALVILDYIHSESQVKALLPVHTDLHPDSLILITSRKIDTLIRSSVEESLIYTLTGLNTEHSRELFCLHSFGHGGPLRGFESLVDKFLEACEGLPLSLKVFGALLYGKNNTSYWEEQLNRLQKILPSEIKQRLKISFDALEETDEKQIFLDIACFFTRENMDTALRVWGASDWNGKLGFQTLQNRCLVTVDSENNIQMHGHVRDMGRYVAETFPPRRLWHWTEKVINDLLDKSGIVVRGIKMDLSECNADDDMYEAIGMKRLQLLDTEKGILERIMTWVKYPNLIWLRWKECPHRSLPSSIVKKMKNLRVLHLSGGVLKTLWEEESEAPSELRELEIHAPLSNIPKSIGLLNHLERIVVGRYLSGRVNLIDLPEEFCDLESLKDLVLKECSRLKSLPDSFGKLTTLEHIDLSFCRNLERLPDSFGSLKNLQDIDLSNCHDLKSLPDSFGRLGNLRRIYLPGCHKLKELPDSFGDIKILQHINLSDCHGLRRLPDSFGDLTNVQYIDLSRCHKLKSLPDSFGNLTNLQHIYLSNCHGLETLPDSFDNLRNLKYIDLSRCHNLERLPNSLRNLNESKVCLEGCSYLTM